MNNNKIPELTGGEILYVTTGDQRMAAVAKEVHAKVSKALEHRDHVERWSYLEIIKNAVDGKRVKEITGTQEVMDEVLGSDELEIITRSAGGNWEQAR